ncbi:hypothetical protein MMC07_002999 [Pseudocyphellaria aurata]|nr:hypothetical protein [Pseudocyphellaria aurata]
MTIFWSQNYNGSQNAIAEHILGLGVKIAPKERLSIQPIRREWRHRENGSGIKKAGKGGKREIEGTAAEETVVEVEDAEKSVGDFSEAIVRLVKINQEQVAAKEDYVTWKRFLKSPPLGPDLQRMEKLWSGALEILTNGERDWKQRLPQDLVDEDQGLHGLKHVQEIMSERANRGGDESFIEVARPFLLVITHPALLDCLTVDIYVGDLYNFISGSGGTRAVPFFQSLGNNLLKQRLASPGSSSQILEETLAAMATALREVLRRTQKALFHENILALVDTIHQISSSFDLSRSPVAIHTVVMRVAELQRMIRRAHGLLERDTNISDENALESRHEVTSTYPRDIQLPGDRHDNDRRDITEISILPTEDEIRSERIEFLPSTSIDQPHFLDGVERLLDTHFRLLRHDIFGELKSYLGQLLKAHQSNPDSTRGIGLYSGSIRAYVQSKASVKYLDFTKNRGLEVQISFLLDHQLQKKSPSERRRWWEESGRLEEGSLLCFLSFEGAGSSLLFLTVSQKNTDPKNRHGLASGGKVATITATLASEHDESQWESLVKMSFPRDSRNFIVEFPTVLLATFVPVLENLQQMQKISRLPFETWIVPKFDTGKTLKNAEPRIPPPVYARVAGFKFDLKAILTDPNVSLTLRPGSDNQIMLQKLQQFTSLDRAQCEALIVALTCEFALIQGPPGTGKSYLGVQIMRVLIDNKLGPIVVVCFTNHALDQFLEHLIAVGIEKVVRIGSHSSSDKLEGKNLRLISKNETKTGSERHIVGKSLAEMEEQSRFIKSKLKVLSNLTKRNWTGFNAHLGRRYPQIHSQFSNLDSEGFTLVGNLEPFDLWTTGNGENLENLDESLGSLNAILPMAKQDIYRLALADREILLSHWENEVYDDMIRRTFDDIQKHSRINHQLRDIYDEVDRRVLETADVIGVTTSGLARRISVLRHVNAKVVICEEAGEVLEAHLLSALIPSVEHLIQIGDHQQLRPQINDFSLSLESQQGRYYQLDRSQFERLSAGEHYQAPFPVSQLNIQRRMRPQISALIRNTLYERLVDHDNVKNLPDVVGIRGNLFWYDHRNHEDGPSSEKTQKSKSNTWEVNLTHALVKHIVRQGVYQSKEIAVLTPYVLQLQKLRFTMRKDFEIVLGERDQEQLIKDGIVDETTESANKDTKHALQKKAINNFQGEEAKIVIVSLVRSNKENKVGFLKTTNRINVLLSRAQHGMYLIGNSETYSNVPMWSQVLGMLRFNDSLGEPFSLCCPRHKGTEMLVSNAEDFSILSPEGGYDLTIAAIDVCQNATRTPCTRRFHALSAASGSFNRVVMSVQNSAVRPAAIAILRSPTFCSLVAISKKNSAAI